MKFKDEIKKISENLLPFELCLSNKGGCFFGVKKIIESKQNKIEVLTAFSKISITGDLLRVVKFIDGDLTFLGNIEGIEVKEIWVF